MVVPNNSGARSSAPHALHVRAISDPIGSLQSGHAVITRPPQSGQLSGTVDAAPAINLRPQPQRRQKPQQSPSSRDRS